MSNTIYCYDPFQCCSLREFAKLYFKKIRAIIFSSFLLGRKCMKQQNPTSTDHRLPPLAFSARLLLSRSRRASAFL